MNILNDKIYETKVDAEKNIFTGIAVVVGKPELQNDLGGHFHGTQSFGSWVRLEDFTLTEPGEALLGYAQGCKLIENIGVISNREEAVLAAENLSKKYNAPICYK